MFKWIFKLFMGLQVSMYRRSGGEMMGSMRGMPLLLLTTVGRKTGKQRVTPVMYIRDEDNYVITASNGGFSPRKYWCPQNSSFRSSMDFHSSAGPIE